MRSSWQSHQQDQLGGERQRSASSRGDGGQLRHLAELAVLRNVDSQLTPFGTLSYKLYFPGFPDDIVISTSSVPSMFSEHPDDNG
jgi:hypothetical protein